MNIIYGTMVTTRFINFSVRNSLIQVMQYFFRLYRFPRSCYDVVIKNSCGSSFLGIVMTNVMFLLILEFDVSEHYPSAGQFLYDVLFSHI